MGKAETGLKLMNAALTVDGTVAGSLTVKDVKSVTDYGTFANSFTERFAHG